MREPRVRLFLLCLIITLIPLSGAIKLRSGGLEGTRGGVGGEVEEGEEKHHLGCRVNQSVFLIAIDFSFSSRRRRSSWASGPLGKRR